MPVLLGGIRELRSGRMKAKKAVRRLNKVEDLLSSVLDQYAAVEDRVRELLDSAKESVVRARASLNLSPRTAKKPAAKATRAQGGGGHLTADGRRRLSIAAKKRWATAKRKGINAVTGRPLSKTA